MTTSTRLVMIHANPVPDETDVVDDATFVCESFRCA